MRAFARDLGVSAPHLSQVIKGTKTFSSESARKIASILKLNREESEYFGLLVQIDHSDSDRDQLISNAKQFRERNSVKVQEADQLEMIKEWYHIPILEMIYLTDFNYKAPDLAKRLGITAFQAENALSRLCRLGLLKLQGVEYIKSDTNIVFRSPKRHEAFKAFHCEMIDKASQAVESKAIEERVIASQTFCMDVELLDEAKTIIREFSRKMTDLFAKSKKYNEVYQLNVQFFGLSETEDEKEQSNTTGSGSTKS